MGADLITVVLAKPTEEKLNWPAAHAVIDAMELADFSEEFVWLWGFDDPSIGEDYGEEYPTVEELRDTAHRAFNTVEADISSGARYLNVFENYLGGGFDLIIVGDRSWGDTPDGYDEFVTVSILQKAGEAAGFVFDLSV